MKEEYELPAAFGTDPDYEQTHYKTRIYLREVEASTKEEAEEIAHQRVSSDDSPYQSILDIREIQPNENPYPMFTYPE